MEQHAEYHVRIERALADLEQRMVASHRRERRAMAMCVFACVIAVTGWTPLTGQAQKSVEERVSDLEKRTGGFQIEDGTTRLTAPVEIYDDKGKVIALFKSNDGRGFAAIGNADEGYAVLGSSSTGGGFLKTYGSNRKATVTIGAATNVEGKGVYVMDAGGSGVEAQMAVGGAGRPHLDIGPSDEGGVSANVGDSGEGVVTVRYANGGVGAIAGKFAKFPMGLHTMGEGGTGGVTIRSGKLGGRLQVHDAKGVPVGGFFSDDEGGAIALTGANGGDTVVGLGARGAGGSVRVYSVGGSSVRAALDADDKVGGVTVFATDGKPAGTMAARAGGSGYFQLLYNGITMVDAAMNEDNVGVVRAGPSSQKTVGVLAVPYRLVGRR